jgi:hypothetical protein
MNWVFYIQEYIFHTHCRGNLKSYIVVVNVPLLQRSACTGWYSSSLRRMQINVRGHFKGSECSICGWIHWSPKSRHSCNLCQKLHSVLTVHCAKFASLYDKPQSLFSKKEPHGVISQKTAFFVVTAMKTSNLTFHCHAHVSPPCLVSWAWSAQTHILLGLWVEEITFRYGR